MDFSLFLCVPTIRDTPVSEKVISAFLQNAEPANKCVQTFPISFKTESHVTDQEMCTLIQRHLGCFQLFTITNVAIRNNLVHGYKENETERD